MSTAPLPLRYEQAAVFPDSYGPDDDQVVDIERL
jgi:hypothetical protein